MGIGQDITARLAQEREYSKLIDTANAPIFGVDTQGGTLLFSSPHVFYFADGSALTPTTDTYSCECMEQERTQARWLHS